MKILVTGGAGFIGSHLVEGLLAAGDQVRVVDNLSTGKRGNLPIHSSLEFIEGDVRDIDLMNRCVAGMDAVIHLAAVASVQASIEDPIETHQINFHGTLNLLEASRRSGINRFLYASSAAIYGDAATPPVPEDAPHNPLSPYAADKLSSEYYLLYYCKRFNLPATVFRFFNVYGPRQDPSSPYSGVISIFIDRVRQNLPITVYGKGTQTRDFVYVNDLVELLVRAIHEPVGVGEVFNVGTGVSHSLLELLGHLEKISKKKIEVRYKPARLGDIEHSRADASRLKSAFDTVPNTPFATGIEKLFRSLE